MAGVTTVDPLSCHKATGWSVLSCTDPWDTPHWLVSNTVSWQRHDVTS